MLQRRPQCNLPAGDRPGPDTLEIGYLMIYSFSMEREHRLYLRVGDQCFTSTETLGRGVVVEERTSEVPGGFCYVRISFGTGMFRVFDNNFRSQQCCYYAGIRKINEEWE